MDNNSILGELKSVPLREVWTNEARDFTPWLLDNAHILSEAIGLELDLHEAEHSVGRFSLDLFGTVEGTDDIVIVENQLEDSDHKHFGQLMTYAGGTDAKYVIWIAPRFHQEYISAIEWLNNGTTENINFFAIEVSAVQIDDSRPAPLFKIVAQPNSWARDIKNTTLVTNSEKDDLVIEFWNKLLPKMRKEHPEWKSTHKGTKNKFIALSAGIPDVSFNMSFNNSQIKSELYFGSPDRETNKSRFDRLYSRKDEIETKYGAKLEWHFPDNNTHAIIRMVKNAKVDDKNSWDDIIEWMFENQASLRSAVKDYLKS